MEIPNYLDILYFPFPFNSMVDLIIGEGLTKLGPLSLTNL